MTTQTLNKRTQNEITYDNRAFIRDGKYYFILSGEMHYFRINADDWHKHLQLMKDAGLNTVSTYIPWSLHEQVEGSPDFSGKYAPNLDLERFIGLCKDMGMNLTVKPGPYILAELAMHGIPKWFFKNYPQALACDINGKPYPVHYTCLVHPDYRRKAMQWYDSVMPLLAANQTSEGGPIALLQVCNEVGLFQWLAGAGDYSLASLTDYRNYLKSTYSDIIIFNSRCKTNYKTWNQIYPPSGMASTQADHFGYQDWQAYHRYLYSQYIGDLIDEIRKRGITTPLFHNVPGWVYSRAKDMPVCLSMYHELSRLYPDIMLGVDHIPENISYRNFHDDRIINEYTKAIQAGSGPMYVAELQAGTREANVTVYPAEMELFYKSCLANGVVAMNYYMFSSGNNPEGWSVYDSSFYLQTPLDAKAAPGNQYPVITKIGKLINTHGSRLCKAANNASQAIAFYPYYYYRELTRPLFTKENFDPLSDSDSRFDPAAITDDLLFDSLAKLLAMDNHDFDAVDITNAKAPLSQYKQIWLASTNRMDQNSQQALLDYVSNGGHLISFPTLPKLDLDGNPCSILADGLNIQTDELLDDFDGMINFAQNNEEIHATRYIETFKANDNTEIIATAKNNKPCGMKVSCSKGSASVLGTGFMFQAVNHKTAWQKFGLDINFKGPIECDNPNLILRTRQIDDTSGYVFILNFHNAAHQTRIIKGIDELKNITIHLPAFAGLVLPYNFPLTDECTIAASTSELLAFDTYDNKIDLQIAGSTMTKAHMVIQSVRPIDSVSINNTPLQFDTKNNRTTLSFHHTKPVDILTLCF